MTQHRSLEEAAQQPTRRRPWISSIVLILLVLAAGAGLAKWKLNSIQTAGAAAASQPEPAEAVTLAVAQPREHRQVVTSVGTVLATQSITLRNELAGTVQEVAMVPGRIVEAGDLLLQFDVSVETAELQAQQAQAALAQTIFERNQRASENRAVSETEVDRSRSERDVALAQVARTKAVIAKKSIHAPFRARVGMLDLHRGQYLQEGTLLTSLQGIANAVNVDFAVSQRIAAGLRKGDEVRIYVTGNPAPAPGTIVAIDSRVDPETRSALVRARLSGPDEPAPGASVRVEVPDGPAVTAVVVPVSALRKGPAGDHVFVIAPGEKGELRAKPRRVVAGPLLGNEVLILDGLVNGEQVAATGSFKLREGALVVPVEATQVAK